MNDKPQLSLNVSGRKNDLYFGSNFQTVDSNLGTNSQDQFFLGYNQQFAPFALRWQVTYKAYPGTEIAYNDSGLAYQVTASHAFLGFNTSLGAEYTDTDYSSVRKSYGLNASISRGLLPKLSGWLSISHKHQWGSVDYTNTNIGLYYQLTQKIGVSTSVNNWHAYADWARDNPTFSISLSRRL